jgi:diguanylate cyclase (GGDEF)-like protein
MKSGVFDGIQGYKYALETVQKDFMDLVRLLSISEGVQPSPGEIQAEAGALLSDLSLAVHLQEETARAENRSLQHKASTDALTGLSNRADFDRQFNDTWREMSLKGQSIAIIMIDVDHFKRFNDTFGHQTGDAVLRSVGRALPGAVRSVDSVARYGGEEFVAILPNADRLTTAHVAVKIRKGIESCVVDFGGQQHRVTVSVGVALLPRIGPGFRAQMLIEIADRQLYAAKQKGRNCCCMTQIGQPTAAPPAPPAPAITVGSR